eukprot:NODE_63_length_26141_cov_1.022656.p16 type:complete len:242 gc:universal NODE_63_length_26141_cov_1.022656:51-776(+)
MIVKLFPLSMSLYNDIHKEIAQYSSKIAKCIGEDKIYTTLQNQIFLRFTFNERKYTDIYFYKNEFFVAPMKTADPKYTDKSAKSKFPIQQIRNWKSCSLHYFGSDYSISSSCEETENLLCILKELDVPLIEDNSKKFKTPRYCKIRYNLKQRCFEMLLIKPCKSITAIKADKSHSLYCFFKSKYLAKKFKELQFLITVGLMCFVYVIGMRRISVFAKPDKSVMVDFILSIWITAAICLKSK